MTQITDSEIKNYASKYGAIFNIEVTNGFVGEPKSEQAKDARNFLLNLVMDHGVEVKSGLFSVRATDRIEEMAEDLSFVIKVPSFKESLLEKVTDEILFYSKNKEAVPTKYLHIFNSRYFQEENNNVDLVTLEILRLLSKEFNMSCNVMLTNPGIEVINAFNRYYEKEEAEPIPSTKTPLDKYKDRIGGSKGIILEVYTARLFSQYIKDCIIFARRVYSPGPKMEKDIDVGILCHKKDFIVCLNNLPSKKNYSINSRLN
jgi:hypothetical protein